ncbi:carbohydrate ABC transporter permease [Paenibacillus spongiae]|uniref:Carbohydrate ABC transporter permease n=1 Tax=Paenibacillus spongiae TaxID=2909671 RepID=A0ABY5S3H8_9BACL|nr:carbohydrate ABC transporter permease [Paenibacillus spongiae]UVI28451.1 carbohydrate ABC transporter permease [Paenibacillus spongiae]
MGKRTLIDWHFEIANYLLLTVIGIMMFFPFLYIASYSLSEPSKLPQGLIMLPAGFTVEAYIRAFQDPAVFRSILISVGRTVLGPALMIFVTSMAAYCLTRNDFLGVRFWRKFFVFTMYFSSGLIPLYVLIVQLHLSKSFYVYIIPTAISVFSMILIKTYIESLPDSLEEAAVVDGANDLTVFWRVIFPLCLPVIAAMVLFSAVGQWNNFMDTQLYNAMNPELFTLQYVLYQTLSNANNASLMQSSAANPTANTVTPEGLKMAITMITVLPVMMIYPFLQRYFIKGMLVGSIKG